MELFLKATAGVLLTVILVLVVGSRSKELSLLLTLAVCCMVACAAGEFIRPVIDFLENLQQVSEMDHTYLAILLKIVGIGFLAEVAAMVCADAGNATLGKTLQMLSSCVILWLSIPLLSQLLELIQDILGEV